LLTVHVHSERMVLLELSNLSAVSGDVLKMVGLRASSLKEMAQKRQELVSLATLITRYTLQMYSDDCGGLVKYFEFFSALRETFGIRHQRQELASEIRDVLKLVESNYLEEQRKLRKMEKIRKDGESARQANVELAIGVVSAITLPLVIISGMFGMNNHDVPSVSFFWCIGIALMISGLLVVMFLIWSLFMKRREQSSLKYEDIIIKLGPMPRM